MTPTNEDREQPEHRRAGPRELLLDPDNPRLSIDEAGASQDQLREIMISRFKCVELAESIIATGWNPFDPIVAVGGDDDALTVVEGNRRLATLQLLSDPSLAPPYARDTWGKLAEELEASGHTQEIAEIEVLQYTSRREADVAAYIGFRHVTGALKWPALEKAKFIRDLVEQQDWGYKQLAQRLGSYPKHVERHYVAYRLVLQVRDEGLPGSAELEQTFGVLMRALQTEGIPSFIGVTFPGDPAESLAPVPPDHLPQLEEFVRWGFGTASEKRLLPESRRLTDFGQILQSDDAVAYLRRADQPSFERAYFRSGGQALSLSDSLHSAADRLEESVPLVSEHADNPDVTSGVRQASRFLAQILRFFPDVAEEYGFTPR